MCCAGGVSEAESEGDPEGDVGGDAGDDGGKQTAQADIPTCLAYAHSEQEGFASIVESSEDVV